MTKQMAPHRATSALPPPSSHATRPAQSPMNRIIAPGQPGDQRGQLPPAAAARPAMRTGTGIFLITIGAILLFALRSGSPHWLNLQIVGVIMILVGGLGLVLPRLARSRPQGDWLRRWVRPGQSEDLGVPFITADQGGDAARAGPRRRRPDASRRPAQLRTAPLSADVLRAVVAWGNHSGPRCARFSLIVNAAETPGVFSAQISSDGPLLLSCPGHLRN